MLARIFALLLGLMLTACGGGGGSAGNPIVGGGAGSAVFVSCSSAVVIEVNRALECTIGSGKAPYTVSSSDISVATAGKTTDVVFAISGVRAGTASVTVKDASGSSTVISVNVGNATPLFLSAPSQVALSVGSSQSFVIGGGAGPYLVAVSNGAVASATVTGSALTVMGLQSGSTTLVVTDSTGAKVPEVSVSVGGGQNTIPLYTTAASTLMVAPGSTPTFDVGGGVTPYRATSSDLSVAEVAIGPSGKLSITGRATGNANVLVTDAAGSTKSIAVTVGSASVVALYTTAPSELTMKTGSTQSFTIGGGVAPYVVSSGNNSAVVASVVGGALQLQALSAGAASVSVFDAQGRSVTLRATVATTPLALSIPSAVTLSLGADRTAVISGGVVPYAIGSSNEAVVRATSVGGVMTLTPVGNGTGVVQIRDSAGASITLSVTVGTSVALFTSAPSNLTVVPGTSQTFTISGGTSPYFAESTNRAAVTASAAGSLLTITGTAPGTATVAVRDSLGASVSITAAVGGQTPLFVSAPANVVMSAGASQTFVVGGGSPAFVGGSPSYAASSSNTRAVTVASSGGVLTLSAVSSGTSTITLSDALGARANFDVTVDSAVPVYTTAPSAINVAPGASNAQTFEIRGGAAPYVAASSNVAVSSVVVSGANVTITGVAPGASNVLVTDRLGASVVIAVTVTATAPQPMTVTPLAASGSVGDVLRFEIRGGSPVYTVTVNNQSIASASAPGTATAFNLTLTAAGATNVAVIDANGQVQNIAVTAQAGAGTPLFTSAPPNLNLTVGVPRTFAVGGGSGSYSFASSDASVVTVPSGSSTSLVVTPLAQGTATVTITDTVGARSSFAVTVGAAQPLVLSSGPAVTLSPAASATTYAISGGRGPYTAASTNESVVTVSPPGASGALMLTPVAAGTANVVVTDAAGVQVTVGVTVAQAGVLNLAVSPAALTANVGEELVLTITGGTAPYTVRASNPAILDRLTSSPAGSPARFRVLNAGATTITVLDSAGQVQEVAVTATQAATQLRLSPTTLLLPETYPLAATSATSELKLTVFGGTAPFVAFTTDTKRTKTTVTGNVISISAGSGSLCSSPNEVTKYTLERTSVTDPSQPATRAFDIVVTVVDAIGASATAKLVIVDDGQDLDTGTKGACRGN